MKHFLLTARVLALLVPLLTLYPLGRMAQDWVEVYRLTGAFPADATPRSFDWVVWENTEEGDIRATYVFPRGPAAEAGLQAGDAFYTLEALQYFSAEDLQGAIQGIAPGQERSYILFRGDRPYSASVRFTRYPTFLYPLSSALWHFSLWGFTLGAFFHLLGLFIAAPLALRSRPARSPLLLILVSSIWIFGNLLRLLLIELLGPPRMGSTYDQVFEGLTLLSLMGWITFPVLLLRKVFCDAQLLEPGKVRPWHLGLYLPALVLGPAVVLCAVRGAVGPLTLDGLLVPILFYASCYIAAAAFLVLALHLFDQGQADALLKSWSLPGSVLILGTALVAALSVLEVVPILGAVTDTTAGWLIVCAQLLFIAPVTLVSIAPLRHGKVDAVLSRALTYLTVLGLIFFVFVGGMSLIDRYLERVGAPRYVVAGLYLVVLLIVFERLARPIRIYAASFFTTDRQRTRQALSRFQEQMRNILDYEALVQQTVEVVGKAFQCRSAILYLRPFNTPGPWISSAYHPEPPYLTDLLFHRIWPYLEKEGTIWARNEELDESSLPVDLAQLLVERGAALAVPIRGDEASIGLLVLGMKKHRRMVYNLEDLELLRALSGQLALAVERLHLVEREKMLARQRAEAQLVALRAQINPHFLFNALNTIISLIAERPEEAEAAVEHLAAIFRHILQTSGHPFVSLEAELALVANYLGIEQARFGDKLRVDTEVDPALLAFPVPAFAIQTLVENAVKHGLEKQREGGVLRLVCRRHDDDLVEVEVSDTGVGIPALFGAAGADDGFFGIGLSNVAARLEQLYLRNDLLQIRSRPGEGTTVRLLLPASRAEAHPAGPVR